MEFGVGDNQRKKEEGQDKHTYIEYGRSIVLRKEIVKKAHLYGKIRKKEIYRNEERATRRTFIYRYQR